MKFANNIVGIIVATPLLSKIITACTASSSARNVTSGVLWTQSARNLFGALMWSSAAKKLANPIFLLAALRSLISASIWAFTASKSKKVKL